MQKYDATTGTWVNDSMDMFSSGINNVNDSGSAIFGNALNTGLSDSTYGTQAASVGVNVADPTAALGDSTGLGTTGDSGASWFGQDGMANTAISGATSLANSWLGFENLGVAKDQYSLEKEQYEYNKSNYDDALARKAAALANS